MIRTPQWPSLLKNVKRFWLYASLAYEFLGTLWLDKKLSVGRVRTI